MTREAKKEYLNNYRLYQLKIRRLNELIHDYPENIIFYSEQLTENITAREKLEREIDAVDGGFLSELLFQKYMCGKSLEEISLCLNYSKRHIERMHLRALDKFNIS